MLGGGGVLFTYTYIFFTQHWRLPHAMHAWCVCIKVTKMGVLIYCYLHGFLSGGVWKREKRNEGKKYVYKLCGQPWMWMGKDSHRQRSAGRRPEVLNLSRRGGGGSQKVGIIKEIKGR